jgi:pimeloyl-ACP methyl ester carboxylesterase
VNESGRARFPDDSGFVERDGVRTYWERFGEGETTLLLLPAWSIVHSRLWKAQIPYLARHFRVVVFDGRGNGRSDRPRDPAAYRPDQFVEDARAVLDATESNRAVVLGASFGGLTGLMLAATEPRVEACAFIGPMYPVCEPWPEWMLQRHREPLPSYEGWARYNVNYWRQDYEEFVRLWMEACLPERHSTRGIEFSIEMGLETDGETLASTLGPDTGAATMRDAFEPFGQLLPEIARDLDKPVLVIQGRHDHVTPWEWGAAMARDTGGELLTLERAGHGPLGRWPVEINLAIREFVTARAPVA